MEDLGVPAQVRPARSAKRAPQARVCSQSKSATAGGYATEKQLESGAPPDAGAGGWVVRHCSDGTLDMAWVPSRPTEAVPATPAQLAQRATSRLRLPLPAPRFEPRRPSSAGPATLVAIPTWFYLDGWAPETKRTQAGGVWAEVTATPVSAMWWPGDGGAPVLCAGPGRAWTAADPAAGTPCRYTYRRSSAGQLGNTFPARVTVAWRVTWRGAGGLSGSLPLMERQSRFPVAVAERQTVVTVGGIMNVGTRTAPPKAELNGAGAPKPLGERRPLPTRSRRPGLIAAAVLLIVGFALGGALLVSRAGGTTQVLVAARPVPHGQVITAADLSTVAVAGPVRAITARDLSTEVGQTAAVGIVGGQVLNRDMLTGAVVPAAGQSIVGLALRPGQLPGDGLGVGDRVPAIVVTSASDPATAAAAETVRVLATGEVFALRADPASGSDTLVTLVVPAAAAGAAPQRRSPSGRTFSSGSPGPTRTACSDCATD